MSTSESDFDFRVVLATTVDLLRANLATVTQQRDALLAAANSVLKNVPQQKAGDAAFVMLQGVVQRIEADITPKRDSE